MYPNSFKEWLLAIFCFAVLVLTSIPLYIGSDEHIPKPLWQPEDSLKPEDHVNDQLNIKLVQQPEDSLLPDDHLNDQTNSKLIQQPGDILESEDYETTGITLNKLTVEETEDKLTDAASEETYSYVAAVVEYAPYGDGFIGLEKEKLNTNALAYIEFAKEAKNAGTDIIVFPEYGLTGPLLPPTPEELLVYSQVIPHPSEALVPCDFEDDVPNTQILKLLSCAVKDLQLYMVVDLIEQEQHQYHIYNTQVVFDRQGTLIARYRKINLYTELQFNRGPVEPNTAMFTTDFGVTFSLQVCFDILYEYPGVYNVMKNGVKHVVMSTAWMDQLPSLTSLQVQSSWAENLGVNLIVANINYPAQGATGSGIYPGNTDLEHHYIFYSNGSKLITMLVTNIDSKHDFQSKDDTLNIIGDGINLTDIDVWHRFKYESLPSYSHHTLKHTSDGEMLTEKVCHNDEFCCNVNYTWPTVDSNTTYMILAYDGFKEHAGGLYTNYYQYCSILHCSSDDINSCAHVHEPKSNSLRVKSLYSVFQTPHVYPSLLNQNLKLSKRDVWSFENRQISTDRWEVAIHVDKVEQTSQLFALTLFGRIYERDISN